MSETARRRLPPGSGRAARGVRARSPLRACRRWSRRPPAPPEPPGADGPQRRRRQMLIFGGIAGAILAVGLTIILIVALSSERQSVRRQGRRAPTDRAAAAGPDVPGADRGAERGADRRPSAAAGRRPARAPPTRRPGISYKAYGRAVGAVGRRRGGPGTLEVPYRVGPALRDRGLQRRHLPRVDPVGGGAGGRQRRGHARPAMRGPAGRGGRARRVLPAAEHHGRSSGTS